MGGRWWHSTDDGKVGMITLMDSRVKAAIRTVRFAQTYGIGK